MALAAGVDIKVVSAMLRHSSIAITADLYAEVVTELAREAAEKTAAMIPRNKARATRRSPHGPPRLGSVQRKAST
jgi:integrase